MPATAAAFSDCTGWLASELKLESGKNTPDIATASGSIEENMLTVLFDKEYLIPEEGIWVGYSFTADASAGGGMPIAVVEGLSDYGLWVHTSRSRRKWVDLGASTKYVSPMVVSCLTDYGPTDVAISMDEQYYAARQKEIILPVTLQNHGEEELTQVGYTYKVGNFSSTGTAALNPPIGAGGKISEALLSLSPIEQTGEYPLEVTITTFNGKENGDAGKSASSRLEVLPFLPVNRPLVEEYTGLECGNCPIGYVTLAQMNDEYGDEFVALAYHVEYYEPGAMTVVLNDEMPFKVSGYPSATVNRTADLSIPELKNEWQSCRKKPAPADIKVSMEYTDDTHRTVRVKTVTAFTNDYTDAHYKLSIAIGANGLYNDAWEQHNYFASASMQGKYWDLFVGKSPVVKGLTFNDVAVYNKEPEGVEGSLPASIEAEREYAYEYEVDMTEVKNIKDEYFINEGARLYAVATLIDAETGLPVNSNKSAEIAYSLPIPTGVDELTEETQIESTQWYDLCGQRIAAPTQSNSKGVIIRIDKMADGTLRPQKLLK